MLMRTYVHIAALGLIAYPMAGQPVRRLADSSPVAIMRVARGPAEIVPVLRQRDGAQPKQKLDELGDSLTQRIIKSAVSKTASEEFRALLEAGYASGLAPGEPYQGSIDRLLRIHRESPPSALATRATALQMTIAVVGFERASPYLRSVATSTDATAYVAMGVLRLVADSTYKYATATTAQRDATRSFLRQLWQKSDESVAFLPGNGHYRGKPEVPDGRAYNELYQYARLQGWTK